MNDPEWGSGQRCLRAEQRNTYSLMSPVGFGPPGFDDRDTDLFLCDTNTCKFDGECLRIGNMVTCICDFKVRPVMFLFSCFIVCFFLFF